MSEKLLPYFVQELQTIQNDFALFAKAHPEVANSLGINQDSIDDPQITRLIESVAFLNGRLQQRLDSAFPEFSEHLLNVLYPNFLRPIPAYSLLEFRCNGDVNATHHIPKNTQFDIKNSEEDSHLFRTAEALTLHPLCLIEFKIERAPLSQTGIAPASADALIELTIKTTDDSLSIANLGIDELKLHLKGDSYACLQLYDILSTDLLKIVIGDDKNHWELDLQNMTPVGFDVKDHLLPYQAASFDGFKLLTEFLMFLERFHAFRFDLKSLLAKIEGNAFSIRFFLRELNADFARNLSINNFSLFSVPIVNLHSLVAEPVKITFTESHYPLILDANKPTGIALFSIDEVLDVTHGDKISVPQIYNEKYQPAKIGLRWQLVESQNSTGHNQYLLKVADLEHISDINQPRTWTVKATVLNVSTVAQLGHQSHIECQDSLTIPASLSLLRRPSLPINHNEHRHNTWALLQHLHCNYQTLLGCDDPVGALKEVLNLYNHQHNSHINAFIESLISIEQQPFTAPIRVDGKNCFAFGTRIVVTLSAHHGMSLFAQLLNHFFAHFAGFHSFTQLDIKLEGHDGYYLQFPRKSGCKILN